ncbi:MAG TPA: sigma-70 family RNA polymerase sigma factor [Opitutaceae bacterium]|nr:sigma-70 family RNA polymerase sigma factor [Opitutaceae bacterium]
MAESSDDHALMARVQAGDEASFGELMHRWELPVKRLLGRLLLNTGEAEDLAQETFVRVWQNRARYRAGAAFRPWLFAIAVNLARNRLRWWRRRPTIALDAWLESTPVHANVAEPQQAARVLEIGERAAAVRDAIARLPAALREAIVLFIYDELSHVEIAEVVGATPKAVETRIARAKEKLRTELKTL